jgi:hypothetical protein
MDKVEYYILELGNKYRKVLKILRTERINKGEWYEKL